MEQTDEVVIKHARNRREYRLADLPHFRVDVYYAEKITIYDSFGCHWHGHHCQPFCDIPASNGDNLAFRYEKTMSRLEEITCA